MIQLDVTQDGFIHAESKEIAIAINKDLFYKTRNQWKINYSEVTIQNGKKTD